VSLPPRLRAPGLAVIGLFGVTAFAVVQRRHEISVRLALGATHAQLTHLLLRDRLRPVVVGLSCGLVLALLGGRWVSSVLHGVSARDPIAIAAAVIVLILTAAAAAAVPARRPVRPIRPMS
jgi:ABC-type antimicrobial peptide transport system permease subunit